MSRNGSGTYTIPNTFTPATVIDSSDMNDNFTDLSDAMTASIAKDGQTTPTANLPMGGFRHTSVGLAALLTQYARADQVQDEAFTWATVGGTGDAITLTTTPAPASYITGSCIRFKATSGNTTAVVVNRDGLGAKDLKTNTNAALALGDIVSGQIYEAVYDGTRFLLTRQVPSQSASASTFALVFTIDGGGAEITTGVKGDLVCPFNATINSVTMVANETGSIVVDIWKDTYTNFPPTDADSITSSTPLTISTGTKYRDTTLSSWTTSITADNILRFNVDSVTTTTRVMIYLMCTRT